MSDTTQDAKKVFKITRELMEGYHKQGLTVKEMANDITKKSGINCSVGTVNKAATTYKINLRAKPRNNGFTFDEPTVDAPVAAGVIEEKVEGDSNESNRTFKF